MPQDLDRLYNYFEVVLWSGIGLAFLVSGIRRRAWRRSCLLASVTFILFGVSDLAEVDTGGWWKPWWLLTWKGACIAVFAALAYFHFRTRRIDAVDAARSNVVADDSDRKHV